MPHGERGRSHAGAATQCLSDTALEHPQADRTDAVAHERISRHDELHIGAVPGSGIEHRLIREIETVEFGVGRQGDDHVRVAHVDADARARHRQTLGADEGLIGLYREGPEVDLETTVAARERLDPGAGADAQPLVDRRETGVGEISREDAGAVAAHLGDRPVGVAVVHEPLGAGCRGIRALDDRRRADDPQQSVGADAEVTVAQHRDLRVGQVEFAVGIGHHHEVVAGAVALGERESRHAFSLRSRAHPLRAQATRDGR